MLMPSASEKQTLATLKFGDLITFSTKVPDFADDSGELYDEVQHVVIFVADGIVFEKTDLGSDEPYRLSLLSDVKARLKAIFSEPGELQVQYGRPKSRASFGRVDSNWTKQYIHDKDELMKLPAKFRSAPLLLDYIASDSGGYEESLVWVRSARVGIDATTGLGVVLGDPAVTKSLKKLIRE